MRETESLVYVPFHKRLLKLCMSGNGGVRGVNQTLHCDQIGKPPSLRYLFMLK